MSQNDLHSRAINLFLKLLKAKIFIYQKFLDTPLFGLIRFRQKVLTVFAPLELFSLEEKAALVAGWPFRLRRSMLFNFASRSEAMM
jgi:hypothetical protein